MMHLLLQLHAPLDDVNRSLYVFGCNDASCYSEEDAGRFHPCIAGGALRCFRSQQQWTNYVSSTAHNSDNQKGEPNTTTTTWGIDDGNDGWDEDDDDWGGSSETNKKDSEHVSMDELETMLTNCEMHSKKSETAKLQSTTTNHNKRKSHGNSPANVPSFEQHDLEMLDEPPTNRGRNDDSDEDDDDNVCTNIDGSKVDQMLSRYLDIEDDEEILSAIKRGGKLETENGKGGGGERYERLPPEERALIAFTKRLKRAPQQVARYAYGGVPLWSVSLPPSTPINNQHRSKQQQKSKKNAHKVHSPLPEVPNCCCGAVRIFESQLLPSLLHVLNVDACATADNNDVLGLITTGGMNWGSVAVYSCSESCNESREEFLIIQESCDAPITKKTGRKDDGDDDMDDG